jgi:uncharacterized protein YdaU (DUF1376 family)
MSGTISSIGHNSAFYGETLTTELLSRLQAEDAIPFQTVSLHLGDYITGTMGMKAEEEGAYIRFLVRLYKQGKPLTDDDAYMGRLMALDVRAWRRIKGILVSKGKITIRAGCLTNERFEKERQKRAEWLKKSSSAATERWEKRRKGPKANEDIKPEVRRKSEPKSSKNNDLEIKGHVSERANELPLNFAETSPKSPPEVRRKSEPKSSKNNDLEIKGHVAPYTLTLDSVPNGTGDAVAAPPHKTLRELMWGEVKIWLCGATGESDTKLRPRIGKWASQFGEGAVLDAICQAQKHQPIDPLTYIDGLLHNKGKQFPARANGNNYLSEEEKNSRLLDRL